MKIVQLTGELGERFGEIKALDMIKAANFDGYDYSMFTKNVVNVLSGENYLEYFENIKNYSDKIGLPCLQSHAPDFFSMLDEKEAEKNIRISLRSIEAAYILGCKIIVIHPEKWFSAEKNKEFLYDKLLPKAKELNVIIAAENMYRSKDGKCVETVPGACGKAEDFVKHIDIVNNPNFKACLDLGHAQMVNCEGANTLINALGGERICALHVHDNDLYHDNHIFPFIGNSDWKKVTSALRKIGYKGNLTFEADCTLKKFPDELIPPCLKLLYHIGCYLVEQIEHYK